MALRDKHIGRISTALLLAIVALPLSVVVFAMLYSGWDLTAPTTKHEASAFWALVLMCAVLPAVCLGTVLVIRDALRGRSSRQVVTAVALLVPTALLTAITLSPRFLHVWRMQLTTRTWHWRHGSSTRVGPYHVPVPDQCFAKDMSAGIELNCADFRVPNGSKIPVSFTLLVSQSSGDTDLEYWKSVQRSFGGRDEERTINLGGESVACFSSNPLARYGIPSAAMMGLECESNRGLSLLFFGPQSQVPAFYAITSQIRR